MIALIDSDSLIYRAGFGCKGDFIQTVELLDGFLQSIYEKVCSSSSKLVLSGASNFRKEIDPNYKINRKDAPKPKYFHELRQYAVEHLGAYVSENEEADDVLGMLQNESTIIVGNDKDLLQIPGYHYRTKQNWADNEIIFVSEEEALKVFWIQCLCGDKTDGVDGVKNPAKSHHKDPPNFTWDSAAQLLDGKTNEECKNEVQEIYRINYGDSWFQEFDTKARLVFIRRGKNSEYFQAI